MQQTVNFNCPHCGNLMAVGTNLLGRNVRCPHCKQVVRAPAAPGEAPAPPAITPPPPRPGTIPSFNVPRQTEALESIFGERHDEDVFGSEPPKPKMPDAPLPPIAPSAGTPQGPAETFAVVTPPPPPIPATANPLAFDINVTPSPALAPAPDNRPASAPPAGQFPTSGYHPRKAREAAPATAAFAWILLIYAGLATIAAGFFGYQYFSGERASSGGEHPYKAMPDMYGEYQKADRRQVAVKGLPDPNMDIPVDLRVKLGDELTVGDLKVTPVSIEQKKIVVTTEKEVGDPNTNPAGQSLVLTLKVKNVSTDTVFDPTDPAFRRARKDGQPLPYTALQIGRNYFYGPFPWPPEAGVRRYYIEGQDTDEKRLAPGEERETWITAAPAGIRGAENVLQTVQRLKEDGKDKEQLLWRVQLRRGLVKVSNESGQEVEMSATAVVGVEFRPDQIKQ
jgi:hypothetical protein